MAEHSLLSPSNAFRWTHCTAAPRFEELFPQGEGSVYAAKGTLAHEFCELAINLKFGKMTKRSYNAKIKALEKDPLYEPVMHETADFYIQYILEKFNEYKNPPYVVAEVRVDLSKWIPEGFGRCDCVMMGDDTLRIVDYKNGVGVVVNAVGNPQMRLYALGALERYRPLYGNAIKYVAMAIVQPNVTEIVSEDKISVEDLYKWADEVVKPAAEKAYHGFGAFLPGDWCRWCRGAAACRARSENYTALEDFENLVPNNQNDVHTDTGSNLLTDSEIGDLLTRGKGLQTWYDDLKAYALQRLLSGGDIAGWKVVAGRSSRDFKDRDAAFDKIIAAGAIDSKTKKPLTKEDLFKHDPRSLADLEKVIGKKAFAEIITDEDINKPMGSPTLVVESDKREKYSPAAKDFADIATK